MVLEKIFKFLQCTFTISLLFPFGKGRGPSLTNLNFLHPRMLCAEFGLNRSSGSGSREEDFNFRLCISTMYLLSAYGKGVPFT